MNIIWLLLAVSGLVLAGVGLGALVRRYRRGGIGALSLTAWFVGFLSLACYAILDAARPDLTTGPVTLIVLAPAFAAVVVLVRRHERNHPQS